MPPISRSTRPTLGVTRTDSSNYFQLSQPQKHRRAALARPGVFVWILRLASDQSIVCTAVVLSFRFRKKALISPKIRSCGWTEFVL